MEGQVERELRTWNVVFYGVWALGLSALIILTAFVPTALGLAFIALYVVSLSGLGVYIVVYRSGHDAVE